MRWMIGESLSSIAHCLDSLYSLRACCLYLSTAPFVFPATPAGAGGIPVSPFLWYGFFLKKECLVAQNRPYKERKELPAYSFIKIFPPVVYVLHYTAMEFIGMAVQNMNRVKLYDEYSKQYVDKKERANC